MVGDRVRRFVIPKAIRDSGDVFRNITKQAAKMMSGMTNMMHSVDIV